MIVPKPGQELPKSDYSHAVVLFVCDCGREKSIIWKNYKTNHTKSCGMCQSDKFRPENVIGKQFGKLTIKHLPQVYNSKTKVDWECDCGNIKAIAIGSVVNGLTQSCGCGTGKQQFKRPRSSPIPKSQWLQSIPELIDTHLPDQWCAGSSILATFKCRCGSLYTRRFSKWKQSSTCGNCNKVQISSLNGSKFGKLKVVDDRDIVVHKSGGTKIKVVCDCGVTKSVALGSLVRGTTTTCGTCNLKQPEWWLSQKFGNLTVQSLHHAVKLRSEEKLQCICTCGNVIECAAGALTSGRKRTCGECYHKAYEWWHTKESPFHSGTISLKSKYNHEYLLSYFDGSFLEPLHGVDSGNERLAVKCKLCGRTFKTKLSWIWHSKICSCGCLHHGSKYNSQIGHWLTSLGFNALYGDKEHKIDNYKLDVLIPSKNVAIELHGLRYHRHTHKKDLAKFQTCLAKGITMLIIYEDEWRLKQSIFKNLILSRLQAVSPAFKLRPSQCSIRLVSQTDANHLYNRYHYIGGTNSQFNIGVHYQDNLVACMSIRRPSRQNAGDYEISRMVCANDVRVHGIWSYLLSWIKNNNIIKGRLVTYSDNRLSDGGVYKAMGMQRTDSVRPDYYWVKNNKRYHKSALRKTAEERLSGKTETQLRTAQGYFKIYDYGKLKWEIVI